MDKNKVYVFRLKPGDDLRKSIEALVEEKNIKARVYQYLCGQSY